MGAFSTDTDNLEALEEPIHHFIDHFPRFRSLEISGLNRPEEVYSGRLPTLERLENLIISRGTSNLLQTTAFANAPALTTLAFRNVRIIPERFNRQLVNWKLLTSLEVSDKAGADVRSILHILASSANLASFTFDAIRRKLHNTGGLPTNAHPVIELQHLHHFRLRLFADQRFPLQQIRAPHLRTLDTVVSINQDEDLRVLLDFIRRSESQGGSTITNFSVACYHPQRPIGIVKILYSLSSLRRFHYACTGKLSLDIAKRHTELCAAMSRESTAVERHASLGLLPRLEELQWNFGTGTSPADIPWKDLRRTVASRSSLIRPEPGQVGAEDLSGDQPLALIRRVCVLIQGSSQDGIGEGKGYRRQISVDEVDWTLSENGSSSGEFQWFTEAVREGRLDEFRCEYVEDLVAASAQAREFVFPT